MLRNAVCLPLTFVAVLKEVEVLAVDTKTLVNKVLEKKSESQNQFDQFGDNMTTLMVRMSVEEKKKLSEQWAIVFFANRLPFSLADNKEFT